MKLFQFVKAVPNWLQMRRARRFIALADAARDRAEWRVAAAAYRDVVEFLPNHVGFWGQLGNVLKEDRQFTLSEAAYRRCLELSPESAETWLQLGHLLKLQSRTREAEYAYLQALRHDPCCLAAFGELQGLGWSIAEVLAALPSLANLERHDDSADVPSPDSLDVLIDVTDLLSFIQTFRRPTGIQRVSLSLVRAWLANAPPGFNLRFGVLVLPEGEWRPISRAALNFISEMAVGEEHGVAGWKGNVLRILLAVHSASALDLNPKTVLLNLGSPIGIANYHLHVRNAQKHWGIAYVQFVHDCIPLIMPEFFADEHVPEFVDGMIQTLHAADGVLVNSTATAQDLLEVSKVLGRQTTILATIKLDGPLAASQCGREKTSPQVLSAIRDEAGYVLFVSTIEPRKNHLLALNTWAQLLKQRQAGTTPRLVCVGKWGWKYAAVNTLLQNNRLLSQHVSVLTSVSDSELSFLYSNCRFAIYPSMYEGWGLPVAEALQHGKLPLIARTSSLPEVAGTLAEYFDLDEANDFTSKVSQLIDARDYVLRREQEISTTYSPRPWATIGAEVLRAIGIVAREREKCPRAAPEIVPGRIYSLAKARRRDLERATASGHRFMHENWVAATNSGSGLSLSSSGELLFSLPPTAMDRAMLLLKLEVPHQDGGASPTLELAINDQMLWQNTVSATRWLCLPLPPISQREVRLSFRVGASLPAGPDDRAAAKRALIEVCGFGVVLMNDDLLLGAALKSLLDLNFLESTT